MNSNDTNKIIHKELSYKLTGLLFAVHNELGRFCREKQYGDALEKLFASEGVLYEREKKLPIHLIDKEGTNRVDFVVDGKILLDLKAKPCITKSDYYQMQRYLQASKFDLGIVVNFASKYLRPIRIIRIHS